MSISDLTNLYPDGLPIDPGPQWPWPPAIEWHDPKERPAHTNLVLAYIRFEPNKTLFPSLLTTAEFAFDDERWWWVWEGEETVETDDNHYTVVCWCEVPPPPSER